MSECFRSVEGMISDAHAGAAPAGSPPEVLRGLLLAARGLAEEARDRDALAPIEDARLVDMLADLSRLRSAVAAIEAQVQVAFDASQRAEAVARGVAKRDAGKGVADQIALARGVSPYRAANDLALARGLITELPATLAKLIDGSAGEQAAINVARETVCLMPEDRAIVDERVAARIAGMSPKRAAAHTRAEAAKVDAESVVRRIRQAHQDRRVSVRPAPDAMVYLSALLPVSEGVAAYAALSKHAGTLQSTGDDRSRGAIMADELVARLTGQSIADSTPVEVQLVMPITALFGGQGSQGGEACGWIGEHPIPAEIAREIALIDGDDAQRWVRRLFTDPISGDITAVDSTRRRFTGAMRRAIVARDRSCRSCDAPIRHLDHVTAYADGGATTMLNGQGLCERCNQAKSLPGWSAKAFMIEGRHVTVTRTPTGHRYVSYPPPPIVEPPQREAVQLEQRLTSALASALPRSRLRVVAGSIDVMTRIEPPGSRPDPGDFGGQVAAGQ